MIEDYQYKIAQPTIRGRINKLIELITEIKFKPGPRPGPVPMGRPNP
jgi:hypothetical protein